MVVTKCKGEINVQTKDCAGTGPALQEGSISVPATLIRDLYHLSPFKSSSIYHLTRRTLTHVFLLLRRYPSMSSSSFALRRIRVLLLCNFKATL